MPRKVMTKTEPSVEKTEVKNEEVKQTNNKPAKREFDPNDSIPCRSVTYGKLFINGTKTGMVYTFSDYDDESDIEYRDLVALIRSKDKAIYKPRIIVMDEDFIEEYPTLKKFYDEHFAVKNIREILEMPDYEMKEAIANLPKGAVDTLKSMAVNQITSGEIDSIRKIKALDEAFGTNLSLLNELLSD